ncbi:iron complex transport system substrate-binding protein [Mycetocola sp. BIGb0189]|uniref:ABC transporter substrate-binding protein n=1 Tax=Mycetocola sp. BIGb0189 TaxID=2940604 RepID=UPI00216A8976|nr:ABC transporter substrate-binding protein [Mycetocola sp. BIGb0189]MCS4277050.1 iron complex transport system substrate-binding protein [Mycetocola sp. BIGb0189]
MRSRALALLAATAVAALALTSCASQASGGAAAAETVSLKTPTGVTIEMPKEPKAALGFYTTDLDILMTLGFHLADTQPVREDFKTFPAYFPQEPLKGLKTFVNFPEYNFEGVLAVNPDFILNGIGSNTDLDPKLQKIAPTYTYNAFAGNDWRDPFKQLATDLGRTDEYNKWTADYQAKVADVRKRLDERGIHPVVADMAFRDGQVSVGCYGVPCLVFGDLGLTITPLANADAKGLPVGDSTAFSLEQLGGLEGIDAVFAGTNEDGSGLLTTDEALKSNAIWNRLPFVTNNTVYGYDYEMAYGSPSGQTAFLEVVEKALLG